MIYILKLSSFIKCQIFLNVYQQLVGLFVIGLTFCKRIPNNNVLCWIHEIICWFNILLMQENEYQTTGLVE